MALMRKSNKWY